MTYADVEIRVFLSADEGKTYPVAAGGIGLAQLSGRRLTP